jgi:hypothetical protein
MRYHRALLILVVGGIIGMAHPVQASVSGRRNTAIGVTGLALYELARGHTTTGLLSAAGAGYAWHRYNQAHKRSTRRSAYLSGYQAGVSRAYRHYHTRHRYRRR